MHGQNWEELYSQQWFKVTRVSAADQLNPCEFSKLIFRIYLQDDKTKLLEREVEKENIDKKYKKNFICRYISNINDIHMPRQKEQLYEVGKYITEMSFLLNCRKTKST